MEKKVIITGVTGQTGSFMAEYLLKNTDYKVIGAVRRTSQFISSNLKSCLSESRFSLAILDLNDAYSISSLIKSEKPDYFINLAGQTFVADSWNSPIAHLKANCEGVLHILEAIRSHAPHCRLYNAGTSEEFGDVEYTPQDENHKLRPRSPYGAAKAAARLLIKVYRESYGMYAVQGFLFNHESCRRQEYFVTRKITKGVARIQRAMIDNKPFEPISLGNMSAKRDWSDAEDFVAGIWKMLNQEVYNEALKSKWQTLPIPLRTNKWLSSKVSEYVLASGETHTVAEFVEKAFEAAGIDAELRFDKDGDWSTAKFYVRNTDVLLVRTAQQFFRPAEVELLLGDSSRARKELGWESKTTFPQLVQKMVDTDISQ